MCFIVTFCIMDDILLIHKYQYINQNLKLLFCFSQGISQNIIGRQFYRCNQSRNQKKTYSKHDKVAKSGKLQYNQDQMNLDL